MDHPDAIRRAEERIATIQAALDEAQSALDDTRRVLQAAEKVKQDDALSFSRPLGAGPCSFEGQQAGQVKKAAEQRKGTHS